jgi:membrane-anchored protein YejM (alkaline phosphatase superfamily)
MTGSGLFLRPSMGSWLTYGLGTENRNLPGFVVLGEVMGNVDATKVFSSAFLPAEFQGTRLSNLKEPIPNLKSPLHEAEQRAQLDVMQQLNARHLSRRAETSALNARIESFELAFRMQTVASDAFDLSQETEATQGLYGLNEAKTKDYGQKCLLARRLVERGVRCVVVNHTDWDQHSNLFAGHAKNAFAVDQPIAGLLADLKQRGLLEDTLVIWGGEFGRTPNTEGKDGRDHNTAAFSMWLAGGGVKAGHIHGVTDEFGAYTTEGRTHVHDLHATILHLMGIDHERFTFRYGGRDYRLTDVFGNVVQDILA